MLLEANQKHEKAQNEAVFKSENQQKTAFPPPKLQCTVNKSFCFENTIYHFSVLKRGLKGTMGL